MKKVMLVTVILLISVFSVYAKTYVVGTEATFPPFEYVEEGNITGFDVELIMAIGEEMGFEVKMMDMAFDSLIPAVITGNIDISIAAMTITPERAEQVDFSVPYWTADQSIIVKTDSEETLTVLFGDKNIGAQPGTTGAIWVEDYLVNTGILTGEFKRYDSFVFALADLENERVDAIVLDSPVADAYAKAKPIKTIGKILTGENYGIAVQKGDKALLDMINEGLKKLEESGKLAELVAKYFE